MSCELTSAGIATLYTLRLPFHFKGEHAESVSVSNSLITDCQFRLEASGLNCQISYELRHLIFEIL